MWCLRTRKDASEGMSGGCKNMQIGYYTEALESNLNLFRLGTPICLFMDFPGCLFMDFPGGLDGKESTCKEGDLGSFSGLRRFPWSRKWQPIPVFLPGEFHGQRSLAGYSPWGHKEPDTID